MKNVFLSLLALCFPCFLRGDIDDHFKAAAYEPGHSLGTIDYIYMINLDQRPEKWESSLKQLAPYGIVPYRFSAVNGWELSVEAIHDVGVKFSSEMEGGFMATSYPTLKQSHELIEKLGQTYFVHCMARGTIGCFLSHLSVLQDAWDRGYKTIWILEDDIMVLRDPRLLCELIDKLDAEAGKENWDILYTDRDMRRADGAYIPCWGGARRPDMPEGHLKNDYSMRIPISDTFIRIGSRYGTHSMIVRRSGMKKLLQFFKAHKIYLPYDMDIIMPYGIKFYTVANDVVGNLPIAPSDNGGPFYLQK